MRTYPTIAAAIGALALGAQASAQGFPGKTQPPAAPGEVVPAVPTVPPTGGKAGELEAKANAAAVRAKVRVMMCTLVSGGQRWQAQLKNTSSAPIAVSVVGISVKDARGMEIGRAGVRDVRINAGQTLMIEGRIVWAESVDWKKAIRAEAVLEPDEPDSYLK